jgi:hypothetical protein
MPVPMRAQFVGIEISDLDDFVGIGTGLCGKSDQICRDRQIFAQQELFSENFPLLARFRRDSAQACARFWPKISGFGTGKMPKFPKICRDWDQAFWLTIQNPGARYSQLSLHTRYEKSRCQATR